MAFAYALLNAALLAIVQILVYVGAISIVIIFAIMLTEVQDGRLRALLQPPGRRSRRRWPWPSPRCSPWSLVTADIGAVGDKALNPGVKQLSLLLFNRYVFPFELVSLVLLARDGRRHRAGAQGGGAP